MKRFVPFEGGDAEQLLSELAPDDRLIPYQVGLLDEGIKQPAATGFASPDAVPADRRVSAATLQPVRH